MLDTQHRISPRSTLLAAELRDALGRRQKELPARWLVVNATFRASGVGEPVDTAAGEEAELGRAALEGCLRDLGPRGTVCVHPSLAPATSRFLTASRGRATPAAIVVVEWSLSLARCMARSLATAGADTGPLIVAIDADCTLALPLPDAFPTPRLYLCLGNTLGAVPAVGAVRMLRVLRSTMAPADAALLGVTLTTPRALDRTPWPTPDPAPHLGALVSINRTFGATLDAGRFDCESRYDPENRRVETHLVARRALEVEIPGVCDVRLRHGESIRTAVDCTFDRTRLTAMLGGVGLSVLGWEQADGGHKAVAVACPAT